MRTSTLAITVMACLVLSGCELAAARAADAQAARPAADRSTSPVTGGEAMFQTIHKLVGRWVARLPNGKPIVDTFQPFASGAYILHEEWVDGKQITSTVFYMVGSQLRADHYCDYLNQPRYTAKPSVNPSVVDLELRDATNLGAHPRHFHSAVWQLIDATHMTQDWEVIGGAKGKVTVRLDFVRTGTNP